MAEGGSWSPATHHRWPRAFKAAARTVLLPGSISAPRPAEHTHSSQDSGQSAPGDSYTPGLGCLPREVLVRVIQLAAQPMSAWMPVGQAAGG